MRISLTFISLILLTFCSTPRNEKQTINPYPVSNIQHSEKYQSEFDAFPFVISYDDTVNISESMTATAILNSEMYQDIADYENFELSYIISASNTNSWSDFKIEPSDTMTFELRFDTLDIKADSLHVWRFITTASFKREGKFFCDTTTSYDHKIFIKAN